MVRCISSAQIQAVQISLDVLHLPPHLAIDAGHFFEDLDLGLAALDADAVLAQLGPEPANTLLGAQPSVAEVRGVVFQGRDGLGAVDVAADGGGGQGGLGVLALGLQADLCGAELETAGDDAVFGLEGADEVG